MDRFIFLRMNDSTEREQDQLNQGQFHMNFPRRRKMLKVVDIFGNDTMRIEVTIGGKI